MSKRSYNIAGAVRLLFVAFLTLSLTAPASSADNFVFRVKNALLNPSGGDVGGGDQPGDFCAADGSGACDGICAPGDHPQSPDCRSRTDDGDGVCEAGESPLDGDCNAICDHPDEIGSVDCPAEEALDHEPVDALMNADMESASQSAWRYLSNGNAISTPSSNETWTDKQIGGARFMTINPTGGGYQDVEVPTALTASGFAIAYNWLQSGNTEESSGTVEAVFLNEAMTELSRITPAVRSFTPADTWFERKAEGSAPAGTKFVRIVLHADVAGAQFDNVDLRINGVKYSTINGHSGMPERPRDRLFDASTVHGPNGTLNAMYDTKWWRRTDGATQLFLNTYVNPFHGEETWRFATTCCSGGIAEYNQMVYIGPGHDGRKFGLEWFQGGNDIRAATVTAQFFSRYEGNLLGQLSPAFAVVPDDMGTMAYRYAETTIPAGTEFVRVTFKMDRNGSIADIGMLIGDENWSRRGFNEGSGLPTTCESLNTYNGSFTDADDGWGWLKYWAQSGYRTLRHDPDGQSAARIDTAGRFAQMVCIPRNMQKSFNGLYWAYHNIREANNHGGGRLAFDFYNSDMELVHTGYTNWNEDGSLFGAGAYPHYGYVPAYGWNDSPATRFDDISSVFIRTERSSGYAIFDNITIGSRSSEVSLPGIEFDWTDIHFTVYNAVTR